MSDEPVKKKGNKNKGKKKGEGKQPFKRQDLAAAIVAKTGLARPKAVAAMDAMLEAIAAQLKDAKEVRLIGFGAFMLTERKAGKGRDPRTGAEIDIPQSKSVRFRPGKGLRDSVSGKAPAPASTEAAAEAHEDEEG
jgi:DNA-binding protein HU-beta